MARRVNTKFVLILGGALVSAAAVAAIVTVFLYFAARDPVRLKKQADTALAAGDKETAMNYYQRAEMACLRQGLMTGDPGVGTLSAKLGDLYYETSGTDIRRYKGALDQWHNAVLADPTISEPLDRLLEERYLIADFHSEPATWAIVEDLAGKSLVRDPKNVKALLYHAESILRQFKVDETKDSRLDDIQKDLDSAAQLAPRNDLGADLYHRYRLFKAALMEKRGAADIAQKLRDQAIKGIVAFCTANPTSAKGYLALARTYTAVKDYPNAAAALQTSLKLDPSAVQAYEWGISYYIDRDDRKNAEEALNKLLAITPKSMETPLLAALVYRRWNRLDDSIAMYKRSLENKDAGGLGLQVEKNHDAELKATINLCEGYMDQAESADVNTAKGKAALAEAKDLTNNFRRTQPSNPIFFLLDGRIALLEGNIIAAIDSLRKSDEYFSGSKQIDQPFLQTKVLLGMAYQKTGDSGLALRYFDEYANYVPGNLGVKAQRALLQVRTMKLPEALHTTEELLAIDPKNTGYIQLRAQALQNSGRGDEASELLKQIAMGEGGTNAKIQLATVQFSQGDNESIVDTLAPVLKEDPGQDRAVFLTTVALMKLKRLPEAQAVVAAARQKNPSNMQFAILEGALNHPDVSLADVQKQMIEKITDPFDKSMAWAQFYAATKDSAKELQSLQDAEKIKPENAAVVDRIFTLAVASKNRDIAERYTQRAQVMNLDGVQGGLYDGRFEFAFGDKNKAIEILKKAVNQRSDFSAGSTILGEAYAEMGKTEEAINALAKAIDQRPDNVPALRLIVQLYFSQPGEDAKKKAAQYLDLALRFAPRDPVLRNLQDVLGNPNVAIAQREATRKVDPANEDNLTRLAVLYSQNSQPNKAIEIMKSVSGKHPENIYMADMLARLYREVQDLNDALKMYEPYLASKDNETRKTAHILYGDLQRSLNQTEEAATNYEQAAAIDTKTDALRRLGDLRFETDDMPRAEAAYKKVMEKDTDIRVVRRYAEALIRQDKFQEADQLLASTILKNNPTDPEGLVLRGYAYLRQHKAKEALACFGSVLETNPDNTDALHYKAFTNFSLMGNRDAAIDDLTRVRSLKPGAVNSRLLLARVYRVNRQYAEASGEYKAVLAPGMRPDLTQARVEYADFLYHLCQSYSRLSEGSPSVEASRIRTARPFNALEDLLQDSIKRYPQQANWPVMLGNMYALNKQQDQAIATLANVYNQTRAPSAGLALSSILIANGSGDQALTVANDLITRNPNAPELHVRRAAALIAEQKNSDAVVEYGRALDLCSRSLPDTLSIVQDLREHMPVSDGAALLTQRLSASDTPTNRIALAQYDVLTSNFAQALTVVSPLASTSESDNHLSVLRIQAMANHQLKTLDSFKKASDYYRQLIAINKDDMESINNLAYLLSQELGALTHDKAMMDESQKLADRAATLLEGRPVEESYSVSANVLDTIGWVRYLNGDSKAALESLDQSITAEPLPIALYHRARIYRKLERLNDARNDLKSALKLGAATQDTILPDAQSLLDEINKLSAR